MLLFEPLFLFVFLPALFALYLLVRAWRGLRLAVLLAGSVLFYLWGEPAFVPVLLVSCAFDYALGRRIAAAVATGGRAGWWLPAGICQNIGLLIYYKYTKLLVANVDALAAHLAIAPLRVAAIALPIGVSFVVFEKITYLVDISRGVSRAAPDVWTYLLYVFFFPKLLAGPIIKYHEIEPQMLRLPDLRVDRLSRGFLRFMLGVVKKTLLADTLAAGADMTFAAPVAALSCADAWWGVAFFTFQIYFDFSAYSDMAIGLAEMFGFELRENFNMPYISCSVTEFWRRWHISLSTWIREYLYFPLGGNRVSRPRIYFNLWLCFLASGLWHGAAWTYVLWGAYNGAFLVLERLFLLRALARLPVLAANAVTFLVTMVGWTVFRAGSLGQAGGVFAAMAGLGSAVGADQIWRTRDMRVALVAAAVICAAPRLPRAADIWGFVAASAPSRFAMQAAIALLFVFGVCTAVAQPFKPFLYFRF